MSIRAWPVLLALTATYLIFFSQLEHDRSGQTVELTAVMPAPIQKMSGYLRQLSAETLYIKAAVFLGGRRAGTDPESYGPRLADHFDVMAQLHPKFLDIYFLGESSLSWINVEHALRANALLARGMAAVPDFWMLPFFAGFNSFYYINDPMTASLYLLQASQTKDGPPWLGHLAAVMAARGGSILAGLAWLRAMLAVEEEEGTRLRYQQDIKEFEKAASVLGALEAYQRKNGQYPYDLLQLVPNYLPELPVITEPYVLRYEGGNLSLYKKSPK